MLEAKAPSSGEKTRSGFWTQGFTGRQRRRIGEALLAYAFLFPAFLIVGIFGLFPLIFAAYESTLTGLNKIVGRYNGLANYVRAIDSLAYVLFFWIAVVLVYLSIRGLVRSHRQAREKGDNPWLWMPGGVTIGLSIGVFVLFIIRLLPLVLEIPNQMRGRNSSQDDFRQLLGEALRNPQVQIALWTSIFLLILGGVFLYWAAQRQKLRTVVDGHNYSAAFIAATTMLLGAAGLTWLTWVDIRHAYAEAFESGEGIDIWSQILTISAGFLLMWLAWRLWESASFQDSNLRVVFRLGGPRPCWSAHGS
ncbi:MAG: sugar ABC transporter permease [Caldilineaceae bacterium]|nr:sugar ABC transporter permease [Caldilineaceae bacterium]